MTNLIYYFNISSSKTKISKYNYKSNIPYLLSLDQGNYKFQLWDVEGGNDSYRTGYKVSGGKGGYIRVIIFLKKKTIWIYIGLKGTSAISLYVTSAGGYNGGGNGEHDGLLNHDNGGGGGDGSTDIRILVAGGGGGGSGHNTNTPIGGAGRRIV
jgi:hypothetical protein